MSAQPLVELVKRILKVLLVFIVILVIADGIFLFLQKNNPQLIENLKNKIENKSTQLRRRDSGQALNFSGTVAAAYANGGMIILKIKSWDMEAKEYIFKGFTASPALDVTVKEASFSNLSTTPTTGQKIKIAELNINDEVSLTYTETEKGNRVSSIVLTTMAQNFEGIIYGIPIGVQKTKLTVDSNKEMLVFGIENTVRIGPKFKTEKVNGNVITRPGETTVEKDFSLVKPMRQVEIIYTKGDGELLRAKTIYFLN